MPKVLNKRRDIIPPDAILVDRTTKWGNPFLLQVFGSRQKVIDLYRNWLRGEINCGNLDLEELRGKDLVCWCTPLQCHADVLLELANR